MAKKKNVLIRYKQELCNYACINVKSQFNNQLMRVIKTKWKKYMWYKDLPLPLHLHYLHDLCNGHKRSWQKLIGKIWLCKPHLIQFIDIKLDVSKSTFSIILSCSPTMHEKHKWKSLPIFGLIYNTSQ